MPGRKRVPLSMFVQALRHVCVCVCVCNDVCEGSQVPLGIISGPIKEHPRVLPRDVPSPCRGNVSGIQNTVMLTSVTAEDLYGSSMNS